MSIFAGLKEQFVFPQFMYTGLKTVPLQYNYVITPTMPWVFTPINNELLQVPKSQIGMQDIYHKPVLMMVKTPEIGEYDAYLLEHGLPTLMEQPQTRQIYENIQQGEKTSAVILQPFQMYNPSIYGLLEGLKVRQFQAFPGLKTTTLIEFLNAGVPTIFLQGNQEMGMFESLHLMKLGNWEIPQKKQW